MFRLHGKEVNIELHRTVYDVNEQYSPSNKRIYLLMTEFVSFCAYFRAYTDIIFAYWDKNYVYEHLKILAGLNIKCVENIYRNREKQSANILKHTHALRIVLQNCTRSTISISVGQIEDTIKYILEILQQNIHLLARIDPLNHFMKIHRDYYVNTSIVSSRNQLD